MKLGIVTFQIAKDWNLETVIRNCEQIGLQGVELRTQHAHGVEIALAQPDRVRVKEAFAASSVQLVGLGSIFEYHYEDSETLQAHIQGTKDCILLARDVGASGIKVRPNTLPEGVPEDRTLKQIGEALSECGQYGAEHGIEVRLEVHGRHTARLHRIRKILDIAAHPNVKVCWNCNPDDLADEGFDANFDRVASDISLVHLHDLDDPAYPYQHLLRRLTESGFQGYCLAEIPSSPDPLRVLRYYKALFTALLELSSRT
ncbi:MAG TPA: sugar phosphate isomerase/epimerase family protein [bacterium]|nr:sugar phosphate isomerase/epimerase family protein [bacterium]